MALRQEQVVFLVTAGIIGLLVVNRSGGRDVVRGGGARTSALELEHFAPPEIERALPLEDDVVLTRGIFSPPRDTRPLAPLDLVEPPRRPSVALAPPPVPGPAARYWSRYLLAEPTVRELPGLFGSGETSDLPALDAATALNSEASGSFGDDDGGDALLGVSDRARTMLEALGRTESDEPDVETPSERAARFEGYKEVYDWVRINDIQYLFGRIENEDRYGITDEERLDEPILFVALDPVTGAPGMSGQSSVSYARERITSLGFANTVSNQIELRRRDLGALSPAEYLPALEFADWCVRMRHEAPRALEVARELYVELTELDPNDPLPRLGMATCLEAGFDFEAAFEEYERLVDDYGHRAVVHLRLAALEERFLLLEQAERRMRKAVSVEPSSFEANHALGRFLLERSRGDEALALLERAASNAPREPELKDVRTHIRYDLARAQIFAGRVDEALETVRQMARGDAESPLTRAASLAVRMLAADAGAPDLRAVPAGTSGASATGAFLGEGVLEARVSRALWFVRDERWAEARDELLGAVDLDPLRANIPLRALSWLAERTGYSDQALRYAELAVESRPDDAYALYQSGRLRAQLEDVDGARQAFLAALAVDVELVDALLALGELSYDQGRFAEAERYFERAAELAPERENLHALRGVNFLVQGQVEDARASFERARDLDFEHPTAQAGLAWVEYLAGDPEEALIQLANLDERRRALAEDDPWRVWSAAQIERLSDHLEKVAWSDGFERREIRNRWFVEEKVGPRVEILDGVVRMSGVFDSNGRTRLFREYPAGVFVSFEGNLRIQSGGAARVGLFLSRERERRGATEVISAASLARHKDGALQTRLERSGDTRDEWDDVPDFDFPLDEWVRVRVERSGDGSESTVSLSLNGIPLLENEPLVGLGRATSALRVGVFAEGETGRKVHVEIDDIEVVFRQ